ncbi:HNH endonuclease [Streptomyces sp. NPDC001700]
MSHHATPHLNAARRRARKRTLARRDGARCSYCWTPFTDLRTATLDHVVPISLLFTWRPENLVLACRSCNDRKADRLPISVALLLCAHRAPSRVTVNTEPSTVNANAPAVNTKPSTVSGTDPMNALPVNAMNGVNTPAVHPTSTPASTSPLVVDRSVLDRHTCAAQSADDLRDCQRHGGRDGRDGCRHGHGAAVLDWLGLARLAHAAQSAADAYAVPPTGGKRTGARVGRLHTPGRDRSTGVNHASTPVDRSTADPARLESTSRPGTRCVNGRSTPVSHRSTGVNRAASRAQPRAHDTQPRAFRAEPRANRAHGTRLCDAPRTRPCDGRPHAGVVSV